MLTARTEAPQRLPLPLASPKDSSFDAAFAELLRRLDDTPGSPPVSPAEKRPREVRAPEERVSSDPAKRLAEAPMRARDRSAAPSDKSLAAEPTADTSEARRAAVAQQDSPSRTTDAPASANQTEEVAAVDPAIQLEQTTALPIAVPVALPTPPAETAESPVPNAETAAAQAVLAAAHPEAEIGVESATNSDGATPSAHGKPAVQSAPAVLALTGDDPAGPAAPAWLAAADTLPAADTAPDLPEQAASTAEGALTIQVGRPSAAAMAPALGKLTLAAEVALAAQAVGDELRQSAPGQLGKGGTGTPEVTAASPLSAAGDGKGEAPVRPLPSLVAAVTAAAPPAGEPGGSSAAVEPIDGSAEILGALGGAGLRTSAAATATPAAASRSAPLPSPAEQVVVQIQRAISDGTSRITVELKPAELGSIEVRLDFGQDGRVSGTILADRPETLDLLQRDARILERSLQEAGLKADTGSLTFDLRGGARQDQGAPQTAGRTAPEVDRAELQVVAATEMTRPAGASTAAGGIDIRV